MKVCEGGKLQRRHSVKEGESVYSQCRGVYS